jgi:hypothetical protein
MIILTKDEADKVRGNSDSGHAIEPILLTDGTFMLGEEVLSDPHHESVKAILEVLPKRSVDSEKETEIDDAKLALARAAAKSRKPILEIGPKEKAR